MNYPGAGPFEVREYRIPCQSDKTGKDKRIAIYNCWKANIVNCDNGGYLVLTSEKAKMQAEKRNQVKKEITALKKKSKRGAQKMKMEKRVVGEAVDKGNRGGECDWTGKDDQDE